ncbi:Beta-phosphoglucomutase [Spironucleus salmonicida]|uniref:Beta-phosphoglucomutase n=1 Tax=Spironucleus salmonicida TaxID=348837 RepID=V6LC10_9EUKA|nr:Beta-phosphoglucomutase [Spironucleus salmonicida]|eukprot:EST42002.1 Hydrolase, haloacid dehalogenase-like family [Spironucleus salmonicida]
MMKKIQEAEAIIFDFDGTLALTHKVWQMTEDQLYKEYDVKLDMDHYLPLIQGNTLMDICKEIVTYYKPSVSAQQLFDRKCDIYSKNVKHSTFVPGAKEFLQKLYAQNAKIAIASANPTKINRQFFEHHKATDVVPNVFVSCDDVGIGKPNPAVFLEAAKQLNVNIQNCVIFEDSPIGIQAAKAAGAMVVCIGDRGKDIADFSIKDFTELVQ